MKPVFALSALLLVTGCGGSSGATRPVVVAYQLDATLAAPLTAPLAVGASTTINVLERRCTFAQYQPGVPTPSGTGCGSSYVPASVTPGVLPMRSTNQPCPVTATVTAPGVVKVTRTGPGDPLVIVNGVPGGCIVTVDDLPLQATSANVAV